MWGGGGGRVCVWGWGEVGVTPFWRWSSKQLPAASWFQVAIRRQEANYGKWRGNHTGVVVTAGAVGSDSEVVTAGVSRSFFQDLEKSDAACATSRDGNK